MMETYLAPTKLVENPHFQDQRQQCLAGLTDDMIDAPIIDLVNAINQIPCCFTLQSCYGHFLYRGQEDRRNLDPIPLTNKIARVEYRLAYIACCIDNNARGRNLFHALAAVAAIDADNIQFCSPGWFWQRQVNSYALQVEPSRFEDKDKVTLSFQEALRIEKTRNTLFGKLAAMVADQQFYRETADKTC